MDDLVQKKKNLNYTRYVQEKRITIFMTKKHLSNFTLKGLLFYNSDFSLSLIYINFNFIYIGHNFFFTILFGIQVNSNITFCANIS